MRHVVKFLFTVIFLIVLGTVLFLLKIKKTNNSHFGTVIVLNGPSGSGKSSIQKEFQKLMMPNLWLKVGIDGFFDAVMPEITAENLSYWQSKNDIRWVEHSTDQEKKKIITLFVGPEGDKVAYAMNSAIAAYAQNGCNVIVDYIAYDQNWFADLQKKLKDFNTYYVAVTIPIETLEQREIARATSPAGHARSHYYSVYGEFKYDLTVNTQDHKAKEIAQQLKVMIQ